MIKIKRGYLIFFVLLLCSLAGCSSSDTSEIAKMDQESNSAKDSALSNSSGKKSSPDAGEKAKNDQTDPASLDVPNQMVIYQADLQLRVKKFDQTVQSLEERAEKYGGYIASSNVTREGKEQVSGSLTIRIPQTHFQEFLHDAEGQAAEVLQRNITGQDVTEEYVDLESRLKSKRAVEERLLAFMNGATKTEDLLKISTDLAAVQEEIEVIEGRMKFLENQTAFSTVTITLYENKVIVPNIDQDKLNTWENTKKQFMKSTNLLLMALSSFVVFMIGNLPIFIILVCVAAVGYILYKKRKNRQRQE